jgi:hypothetical protein
MPLVEGESSMSTRTASVAQHGAMALGSDDHPRGLTPKLGSVGDDPDERFYMLATFCFDLSRKMKYISLALQEFYEDAPPEFALKIRRHEQYINPRPEDRFISWKEMAERSEEVMKELWSEVQAAGYKRALDRLANEAGGK